MSWRHLALHLRAPFHIFAVRVRRAGTTPLSQKWMHELAHSVTTPRGILLEEQHIVTTDDLRRAARNRCWTTTLNSRQAGNAGSVSAGLRGFSCATAEGQRVPRQVSYSGSSVGGHATT